VASRRPPRRSAGRTAAWAVVATILAVVTIASTTASASAQDAPARVVATVGMIGDVAAELAAGCAEVTTLMGPGIDPHLYQATSGDVRDLGRADLILYAGLTLEGQLGEVLARFSERTPTVAVAEEAADPADRIRTSSAYGVDPHVWMDASLWAGTVPVIADALAGVAPACEAGVRTRAAETEAALLALHDWVGTAVATIPEERRVLVTAHDAFAYYGRAYGIQVAGIQGVSTEAEPSIADIRATARTIADAGVPAVFIETTINPRTIQAVLDAAADLGHQAALGGSLYSDAMGEPGTPEGSYVGMLRANTVAIVTALGGTVPPLPEALRPWAERYGVPMDLASEAR
jgi:manganese/zinc/iron transport system substrate-binding protein